MNIDFITPYMFFHHFIAESLFSTAFAYGIVWLSMRQKETSVPNYVFWHIMGITIINVVSAIFRVIAIATFAGISALNLSEEGLAIYFLIVPAIISTGYIAWLKTKAV